MVWFKSTEIIERKKGFKSAARGFDDKLNALSSAQNIAFEKLEKLSEDKQRIIEKLEKMINELEKEGKQAETEKNQLVVLKEKFKCDVCNYKEILSNKNEIINASQLAESEQFGKIITSGVGSLFRNIF